MKERILSLFMAVVFCCSLLPTALADEIAVQATGNEAKIGDQEYATLTDAINAITNLDQTVVLLKNVTLPDDFSWRKDAAIQINMDDHSITFKDLPAQTITESLTLTNGTLSGNVSVRGTLHLTAPSDADAAIKGSLLFYADSTVNISGAKVGLDGSLTFANNSEDAAKAVISGTEQAVKNTSEVSISDSYGSYGIYGSTAENDSTTRTKVTFQNDTYTVNGEAAKTLVIAPKPTITLDRSSTIINAGETAVFNATYDGTDNLIASVADADDKGITASVDGKKITVTTTTDTPNGDYTLTVRSSDDDTITQTATITVEEAPTVATVGDTNYSSLAGAIAAANGAEITLVGTVTESITVPSDTTVNIDLHGQTWQSEYDVLTINGGTVTLTNSGITGEGHIVSTAGNAVNVKSGKLAVVNPYVTLQGGTNCAALFVESNCDVTLEIDVKLLGGLATRTTIAECLHMEGKALQMCNVEDAQRYPYVHLDEERTAYDVEVIYHSSHDFSEGVCYTCGYVCPHTSASETDTSCPDCSGSFVARVAIGGKIFPHITIEAALAAADAAKSPATVTLLDDAYIGDSSANFGFEFRYSNVTIDLSGHELYYPCRDYALALDNADVTIKNGKLQNIYHSGANAVQVRAGTLALKNVTFTQYGGNSSGITVSGDAKLIVAADSGDSQCVFDGAVEIGGTAQLSGGVYNKGISYGGDYGALVADGYAFADANGSIISYSDVKTRMESTDESTDKTLRVVPHTHSGSPCECGLVCTHPTDKVSENGKCTVCNYQYTFKTDAPYKNQRFFDSLSDAVNPIFYGDATTITLLKDAAFNLAKSQSKAFTLDLQNFTLSSKGNLNFGDATVTLRGGENAKLTGTAAFYSGCVILSADFKGYAERIEPRRAVVQSGSVGILVANPSNAINGDIQLQGGSFDKIVISGVWNGSTILGKLLAPGYRFQRTDGSQQPPKYNDELSYNYSTLSNVKVVPCTAHEYSQGYCVYCHAVCPHTTVEGGVCTVCRLQMTAQITADGQTSYYADLDSALTAAKDDETVTLLKDADNGAAYTLSKALTLDLNGHSIVPLMIAAPVTLKDSGETKGTIGSITINASGLTLGDLLESEYSFRTTGASSQWLSSEDTSTTGESVTIQKVPIQSMDYPRQASTPYGTSCTISVAVQPVNAADTVTYQWYQVTNSEASEITDAQNNSYVVPDNLNADQYTYRVAVTVDGYTQMSENILVTVQPASIAGKEVTVSTTTYSGTEQVPSVTVEGLSSSDYTISCTPAKNVGTYDIEIFGTGNYTGSIKTNWQIAPAQLTPIITGVGKTYDGSNDATVNVSFSDLQNDETLTADDYTVSAHYEDANAAADKRINGTITLNDTAKARNYILKSAEFETTGHIYKAAQVLTAKDITAVYGDTDKAVEVSDAIGELTYFTSDSAVAQPDTDGVLKLLKSGDADITIHAAGDINHNDAQTIAHVHVTKREISVKADDKSMTVGGALPVFTVTYGNFAFDETADTVFDIKPLPTTTADGKTTGTFDITVEAPTLKSGMEEKYTIGTPVNGVLTVNPRTSSGGGGGSSASAPTYKPSVTPSDGGTTTVSNPSPKKGDTVTITPKPDADNEVAKVIVTDKNGKTVEVKANADGTYSFTQPDGTVKIEVVYQEKPSEPAGFTDVSENHFAYNAVQWAQDKGITEGIGNGQFGAKQACSRAQIVTFLWRAAGSPEPNDMPNLSDISRSAYYAKAVAWAVENGITSGTSDTTFSPESTCTRAQAVTFLARAMNAKADSKADFTDVPADAYYANAVAWAAENGITEGMGNGQFAPNSRCTRAQIVTFLYRAYQ